MLIPKRLVMFACMMALAAAESAPKASAQNSPYTCTNFSFFSIQEAGKDPLSVDGLNDQDTITGWYVRYKSPQDIGFIRYVNGDLHSYSIPNSQNITMFDGINDQGQIVGTYGTNGFLKSGSTLRTITYPGAEYTSLLGINNTGAIVGTNYAGETEGAFLDENNSFVSLAVSGAVSTVPTAINDAGAIVGRFFTQQFR